MLDFPRVSYTRNSPEYFKAIMERVTAEPYAMALGGTDMTVFVKMLTAIAQYDSVTHKDIPSIPGYDNEESSEPFGWWADDFLSSIGESVNVEGI
jgi:hypothetical protein